MTEENQAPETQEQEQAPGLSLNDISAAVQIIDVATARGAIRGEELLPVGTVRQRCSRVCRRSQLRRHG